MTPRDAVAVLLAQAREDGVLASRLAIRTQRTIDMLADLEKELARLDELVERKAARAGKPAPARAPSLFDESEAPA